MFDWLAGVLRVPFVMCVENWADDDWATSESTVTPQPHGDSESLEQLCFSEYNPPFERLKGELDEMGRFFPLFFAALLQDYFKVDINALKPKDICITPQEA
jgi:hypothetical protein